MGVCPEQPKEKGQGGEPGLEPKKKPGTYEMAAVVKNQGKRGRRTDKNGEKLDT